MKAHLVTRPIKRRCAAPQQRPPRHPGIAGFCAPAGQPWAIPAESNATEYFSLEFFDLQCAPETFDGERSPAYMLHCSVADRGAMIVCICNRLSEASCRDTAASGRCRTVGCMYRLHGHRIRCGKCLPLMTTLLANHAPDSTAGDGRAAVPADRVD